MEVLHRDKRQQAEEHEDHREDRHEHLERDGGSPNAQCAFSNPDHEEAEDIPGAHALKPPRVKLLERRNQQAAQEGPAHPILPWLFTHGPRIPVPQHSSN